MGGLAVTAEAREVEIHTSWRSLVGEDPRVKTKTAFTLNELVQLTSEFSMKRKDGTDRTAGCVASPIRTDRKQFLLVYRVRCNEKDKNGKLISDPAGHVVRLKFDLKRMQETHSAQDLDVRVSCSCVAPDTWVRMGDGTEKMIKDVTPGDTVITHKGRVRKVTHVTRRDSRPGEVAYSLSAEGYREPLVLSEDHPVAVVRGNEVCACGCGTKLGMVYDHGTVQGFWSRKYVLGHSLHPVGGGEAPPDYSKGRSQWKTAGGLMLNEQLYFPRIELSETGDMSPAKASLLGYYLAEGSLQRVVAKRPELSKVAAQVEIDGKLNYLYGVTLALNQNERETLVPDIQAKVQECYPGASILIRDHATQKSLSVEVTSPEFASECYRLMGHLSHGKVLAPEVFTWSRDALTALVSSWALGDGYCGPRSQKVNTASRDIATQMSTILSGLGVYHRLTYEDPKSIPNARRKYALQWEYRRHSTLVGAMKGRMRPHDRTRVEAELASPREMRRHNDWGDGYIRSLRTNSQVEAPSEFYDLTVDEDSSFIANGILVHNCPAFLFYGAQWNLGTGDALYGKPRPKYQPPTEARRYQYVICKHIKVVYDRCKPLVESMVGAYRGVQDAKKEEESKKQIEQVKQQQEQEVQELEPITPKKPLPDEGELEAMPEDLSELGLKPKPPEPKEEPPKQRPPITPKTPPEAEEPEVTPPGRKAPKKKPAPAPAPPPEEEGEEAPGPKARRMVAPNITVHDEDEDETTILPGAKAQRMDEAPTRFKPEDIEVVPRTHKPTLWEDEEEDQPGPKAKRMQRRKEPARIIPMNEDDDDDEPIILPGRGRRSSVKHLMASLVLAQAEV